MGYDGNRAHFTAIPQNERQKIPKRKCSRCSCAALRSGKLETLFTNILFFSVLFPDGACTAQTGQERLQLKVVKCEENATITTPVALASEGFACDNGAPKEEKEQEEEEEEENVEDGDQMDVTLHRLGADEGILVPSASLFEDGHFGMAFTTAAGGSGAAHHYHHQPPSSLNDDLALMVGRPDDRGFFHCPADSCDRKYETNLCDRFPSPPPPVGEFLPLCLVQWRGSSVEGVWTGPCAPVVRHTEPMEFKHLPLELAFALCVGAPRQRHTLVSSSAPLHKRHRPCHEPEVRLPTGVVRWGVLLQFEEELNS